MRLVIGSDHAGFQLKEATGDLLRSLGHEVLDVGAFNENPSDYPDFAEAVGRAVLGSKAERGVLICRGKKNVRHLWISGLEQTSRLGAYNRVLGFSDVRGELA